MAIALVLIVVVLGTMLTFFSGFGLGTLLLPVFLIFFDPETAIPSVALVHFSSSLFKFVYVRKHIQFDILWRFGIPAVLAAALGSWLLTLIGNLPLFYSWSFKATKFEISWLGFLMGAMIVLFTWFENQRFIQIKKVNGSIYLTGGLLSGFFGGISGHQGALRSLFLKQAPLSKEQLVATSTSISLGIDLVRITMYFLTLNFGQILQHPNRILILIGICGAFAGATIGSQLLKKISLSGLHRLITICLFLFGFLMMIGII